MALLRFDSLSFAYPDAPVRALNRISFDMEEGEYLVLCGQSGCGKTTLLRHAKQELTPAGAVEGTVFYRGIPLAQCDRFAAATQIGFVQQNPDNQIVTDYVWHELAFGLENMALTTPVIRRRVAEMASFFGMEGWFRKSIHELSGGQKQMLNLASIMAMNPKLLILDEPTSMLDPLAARMLLDTVKRINRELGVAVLLTEHRLEEVFPTADRVLVMERGEIAAADAPERIAQQLSKRRGKSRLYFGLPGAVRIFGELGIPEKLPLTVRDARLAMHRLMDGKQPIKTIKTIPPAKQKVQEAILDARELWFRYSADGKDILRGLDLVLRRGEVLCLLGGNGAGKSTLLRLLAGVIRPLRGKIKTDKSASIAMLPQHPQSLFTHDTLRLDLLDSAGGDGTAVNDWAIKLELDSLLDRHPFDLSGGEMQRAAMCKLMLRQSNVLLLDEPTKGLDAYAKQSLSEILRRLTETGVSILIVTHDIEFAAKHTDRCALLFDGAIVSEDAPQAFFAGNRFYTTAANRIAGNWFPDAITCEEVIYRCRKYSSANEPAPPLG
ncbi:ATP-binding cassette domain-containing protein [Oscillospiraceae bacterium PP1C4]